MAIFYHLFNLFCKTFTIVYFSNCFLESFTTVNYIVYTDVFLKNIYTNKHVFDIFCKLNDFISNIQVLYNCRIYPVIKQIKMNTYALLRKYKIMQEIPLYKVSVYKDNELIQYDNLYSTNFVFNRDVCENCIAVVEDWSGQIADSDSIINVICYYNIPTTISYKISSIKFLCITLTYNDNIYYIDLLTDKYNYYIVGSVINAIFFLYYIKYHLHASCSDIHLNNFKYQLSLCDNNADFQMLDHTTDIIIEENGYKLVYNIQDTTEDNIDDEFVVT